MLAYFSVYFITTIMFAHFSVYQVCQLFFIRYIQHFINLNLLFSTIFSSYLLTLFRPSWMTVAICEKSHVSQSIIFCLFILNGTNFHGFRKNVFSWLFHFVVFTNSTCILLYIYLYIDEHDKWNTSLFFLVLIFQYAILVN